MPNEFISPAEFRQEIQKASDRLWTDVFNSPFDPVSELTLAAVMASFPDAICVSHPPGDEWWTHEFGRPLVFARRLEAGPEVKHVVLDCCARFGFVPPGALFSPSETP